VCNNNHRFLVCERLGVAPRAIILGQVPRNTAAIPLIVLRNSIKPGSSKPEPTRSSLAARGKLVLFGVKPTEAHTGYGYIRRGASIDGFNGHAFAATAFVEKPSGSSAEHATDRLHLE
jgi:mannose-1-phosphate guanylyltransferase/mannose-6-phosphate isomerase